MVKEKRKTRLEKGAGGGSDFVGFAAFASPSVSASTAQGPPALNWSPVYTGSDPQLSLVFKKIAQKRDGLTKSKALNELEEYFNKDDAVKKEQVAALSHLLFIYHAKLSYDDFSSVRASSLAALTASYRRLPKAWTCLVMEQHRQVWGMIWCAQGDASADVKVAAKDLCAQIQDGSFGGVQDYVRRILTYGRPKAMHDDLFARRDEDLSEMEREQLDERFERISGAAIEGMDMWIQLHPESDDYTYEVFLPDSFLFKTLTSSKPVFRRKTYRMVATMCQHAKSLVYGSAGSSSLSKILPQVMSQEKDLANVPLLFELLILYLSCNGDEHSLNLEAICKPLSKILKKACFGASANQWGPSMLPLLVTLKNEGLAVSLIANLWEGKEEAIGSADQLSIAAAVAESSSFFLLRRETGTVMEASTSKQVASTWLEVLRLFLSSSGVSLQAKDADEHLQHSVARDIFRLDNASYNRTNCALHRIKDWFWDEQVPAIVDDPTGSDGHFRFHLLLQSVTRERQAASKHGDELTRLHPIVRAKFHSALKTYQATSGSVPKDKTYTILIESLNYCGAQYIFGADGCTSIDQFLMNDLLRWMVTHTSSLSPGDQQENIQLAEKDATLLAICFSAMASPSKQKAVWDAILREITMAKCDLSSLTSCLIVLSEAFLHVIKSHALEEFAIHVGEESSNQRRLLVKKNLLNMEVEVVPFELSAPKTANFLLSCVGLNASLPHVLVSERVVAKWLEVAIATSDGRETFDPSSALPNPVLETLVSIAAKGDTLENGAISKVATEAWREGNLVWKQTEDFLLKNDEICKSLIALGSTELSNGLRTICSSSSSLGRNEAIVWSTRARRLIGVNKLRGADNLSLRIVGLSDVSIWQSATAGDLEAGALLMILSNLLLSIDSVEERRSMILEADNAFPGLFVHILLAISKADDYSNIYGLRASDESCAFLLSILGSGQDIGLAKIESWCRQLISILGSLISSPGIEGVESASRRNVSVLSELLSLYFGRTTVDSDVGLVEPTTVKEGQSFWYITNTDDVYIREEAIVTKIHEDDFPRLYFTIRLCNEDNTQEKQTIPERLRTTSSTFLSDASISKNEQVIRSKFAAFLFQKIVKPCLSVPLDAEAIAIAKAAAECMNVVVSQCGIFGKGGLGTFKYEVFQLLTSLQENVILELSMNRTKEACLALEVLSLCMGFGSLTPPSRLSFVSTKFDPQGSIKAIIERVEKRHLHRNLEKAILEWLVVALPGIGNPELREEALTLLCASSARLLSGDRAVDPVGLPYLSDCLLIMKGLRESVQTSVGNADSQDETVVCTEIVRSFCDDWPSVVTTKWEGDDHNHLPMWHAPFCTFVTTFIAKGRQSIVRGAKDNADRLGSSLDKPEKRWIAFVLLNKAAGSNTQLHDRDQLEDINAITRTRLSHWKKELVVQEEADELEDDVVIVGQWLPSSLMNNVESWAVSDLDFNSSSIDRLVIGRMLAWLTVLQYLESAAAADLRNRGAFSSYVQRCNAVVAILDMLLVYLPLNENRQSRQNSTTSIEDILIDEENIEITKLSSLALFRTIEVFPTLSKHWWEEDCPKSLSSALSQLVQVKVAPETLRRELKRIGAASNLGEMSVSGSIVSREVVARYTQDECQLSVVITLPPNFPLRNVDVDGTKTLGVPEKRWKRWALQIRLMLNSQDGTLLDALMLWKENVDKEFEGVEPCPVCYSVLSVKTHELPNLQCKTCDHRFHASCLYKWFKSSGKSQCVLCQQPWSGTRL
jgi:hypothetical protein